MVARNTANAVDVRFQQVSAIVERIAVRRVTSDVDRAEVFALRHRAYLRENSITARSDGLFYDRFDDLPNAHLFAAYDDGILIGSIRLIVVKNIDDLSPAVEVFSDILLPEILAGRSIIDPNRFVLETKVAPNLRTNLPFVMLRIAFLAASWFDVDLATATVRTEHQAFYKRFLRYRVVCPEREYPTLRTPLSLMVANVRLERKAVIRRSPIFASCVNEKIALFGNI